MRIILRHMLPSFASHIIAAVSLALPVMIVSETSLCFLGLGLRPPAISWGILLQDAQNVQVLAGAPWLLARGDPGDPGDPGLQLPGRRPARRGGSLWLSRHAGVLSVRDLVVDFVQDTGTMRALDGVSLDLHAGRVLGVVGESGCGKSVTARAILRLVDRPGRIVAGRRCCSIPAQPQRAGPDRARSRRRGDARGARRPIGLIFQEPMSALSMHYTVGNQIIEAVRAHSGLGKAAARQRAIELLRRGRHPAAGDADRCLSLPAERRPAPARRHRPRARRRSRDPDRRRADHRARRHDAGADPGLLRRLQQTKGIALMLITHDMGVIAQMADDVAVMYLGRVVEFAPVRAALRRAAPSLHARAAALGAEHDGGAARAAGDDRRRGAASRAHGRAAAPSIRAAPR